MHAGREWEYEGSDVDMEGCNKERKGAMKEKKKVRWSDEEVNQQLWTTEPTPEPET